MDGLNLNPNVLRRLCAPSKADTTVLDGSVDPKSFTKCNIGTSNITPLAKSSQVIKSAVRQYDHTAAVDPNMS